MINEIEIEDAIKPPVKKQRGRQSKPKTKAKANPAKTLIDALKFISVAQKKTGTLQQQYCSIQGGWIFASNEMLTVATKVTEDLIACPQSTQLLQALKKVEEAVSITQMSDDKISVSSGSFRAVVPCVQLEQLSITAPDPKAITINDNIKTAFKLLAPLATEGSPIAVLGSVLLQSETAVATNNRVLAEYWHGIPLPSGLLIPKAAVTAVLKSGKSLAWLGCSGPSATFWFEDDSFIKTQLYSENYPNYLPMFNCDNLKPWIIPQEFYKAIDSIENFSKDGLVYFKNKQIASNDIENEASTYTIEGLPEGMSFSAKNLLSLKTAFDTVHFDLAMNKAFFFGDKIRGVVSGNDQTDESIAKIKAAMKD